MRRDLRKHDPYLPARAVAQHPLDWVFEPLEEHPGYQRRKIFGCEGAYFKGRLHLVIAAGEEPWNGLLVATCREFHTPLQARWRQLEVHPVLGKWLYLSQDAPDFETVARAIVKHVLEGDPQIGVDPKPHRRKPKTEKAPKPSSGRK